MLSAHGELNVYARWPIEPVRGEGAWLWDRNGRRFLDMYGGHAVTSTGHRHPKIVAAIEEQLGKLLFYSNVVPLQIRSTLCKRLAVLAPDGLDAVFLANSGAEANDQALALARRVTGRTRIVSVEGGFHGRTAATLAASGIARYRDMSRSSGASSLAELTRICPFDDLDALGKLIADDTAAVIVEPVQGLAGARAMSGEFLHKARALCDEHGALLVFDEVQCGCGRTGAFTAAQSYGVTPDLLTLAKALGSGLPISALLVRNGVAETVCQGDLGSTFGGGPLPAAAALATLDLLEDDSLFARALACERRIREMADTLPAVQSVQGRGLLLGLRLDRPARGVLAALRDAGVLAGGALDARVLRLLPPLNLADEELDFFEKALTAALDSVPVSTES